MYAAGQGDARKKKGIKFPHGLQGLDIMVPGSDSKTS